ncbi:HutD family protein [Paenarthrobacter sp. PH39-S1]|uniref:HutD/Ves family protein n=1 Tax=Paenarthrobacter sp. PH39-S1 TaxID=3046204 RepID=UPI0024B929DE|nr:HutD family protein [Paenarthrobacter sp. PH39-S1]MDJ0355210.1 HutD family protein [Paenarthrobacter sp. PH39-S1]
MDVIRYSELRPSRWANGGGVTRTVAASPSSGSNWDWRISIAEVSHAGPFSPLPGIDRIVTVIDGDLLMLEVDGDEHLLEKYRPFRFSGDSVTDAALPTGNVMDLSVMTRRGGFKAYTTIIELSRKRPHPVFAGQHAVLLQGDATTTAGGPAAATTSGTAGVALSRFDAVAGSDAAPELTGRGFLAIVSIAAAEQ